MLDEEEYITKRGKRKKTSEDEEDDSDEFDWFEVREDEIRWRLK